MKQTKLIRQSKAGDAEAFEKLLLLYSEQMYRTAFLYVGNREDALDVVQETSCKAYLAIQKLKKEKYFATWLTRILINTAVEHLRSQSANVALELVDEQLVIAEKNPVEYLDLIEALQSLRAEYRDVLILFYFQGLSIKEAAEVMQLPTGTVKTYLFRAKAALKTILKGAEHYEEIVSGKI